MMRNREFFNFKAAVPHRAGTLVSDTSDDRHDGARDGFINSRTRFPCMYGARALSHTRALVNKYAPRESAGAYYSPGSKWRVLWNLFNPPDALALSHTNAGNCDRSSYPLILVNDS